MKKVISLILVITMLIIFSANVYATGVLDGVDNATPITGDEYENAQKNSTTNNSKANNSSTTLPQTGAGDFGVGILLIICAGSAIFAYKKVRDYNGI